MAIWKDQTPAAKPASPEPARFDAPPIQEIATPPTPSVSSRAAEPQGKESLIAADLTIEGKIEGAGHVRIAGKFKGDISVQGNLTIEQGAKVTGGVRAQKIIIAGELEGNVESAQQVELQQSGTLTGDLKAGTVSIAPGSRMRGTVEFGWDGKSKAEAGGGT